MDVYSVLFVFWLVPILSSCENVHTTKVFILPIEPNMFNWTLQVGDDFAYQASLLNAPDLPKWIEYTYSRRHRTGFLYGAPPKDQEDIEIEIVGLNRRTYETRRRIIHLNVEAKPNAATHQVHIKIDNLNVEDFFDSYRMTRLLDIFKFKLWKESFSDLYVTFLTSAVSLGARLPLRPNEGEGVVMRLGSASEFSTTLTELQKEVMPLWKHQWKYCSDFKRTTVERLFRDEGFVLDWCNFRLIDEFSQSNDKSVESMYDVPMSPGLEKEPIWSRPTKEEVSQRSYAGEFAFTILIPSFILILLVILLSFILGFQREDTSKHPEESDAQMSQYSAVQRAANMLREMTPELNGSARARHCSPQATVRSAEANGLSRPTPPPYTGTMRTAVVDF